jgi:hypothetical protein
MDRYQGNSMLRILIVFALAVVLVGCTGQGGGASGQPVDSASGGGAAESAGASGSSAGTASAACGDSFGPLAELDITSVSELGDLPNEVQPTVEACESVADWVAGAQQVVANEIDPDTAAFLLAINCEDLSLARTAICEELASS